MSRKPPPPKPVARKPGESVARLHRLKASVNSLAYYIPLYIMFCSFILHYPVLYLPGHVEVVRAIYVYVAQQVAGVHPLVAATFVCTYAMSPYVLSTFRTYRRGPPKCVPPGDFSP